ncbi:MAG: sulfatase-like hydrolase/transferase, partial [Boseongicola sp.]|nr:sulfatase-like hydrolase/transferase [Boseongicola sp.]
HTPGSRCTPTRYSLLTGRYPWRTRLKWWVLFGAQGDPLIERGRPTIASLLKGAGYQTGVVGKWHVGLRYRQANAQPAAGWADASLYRPLFTSPLDHGFDFVRITSRSHGTSGPNAHAKNPTKSNHPEQNVGPGHIHGRLIMGATGNGRQLATEGPNAYVLSELGSRHSDHALEFLERHAGDGPYRQLPFFLYYPSNSNHGPHTPDEQIGGVPVKGAARTKSGGPTTTRNDYIYENDVALGRMITWLENTKDPRRPYHALIDNTLIIFTSDNGAEIRSKIATGPFRSHKGSCYEGGHRVPFIASWPAGGVGNGNSENAGLSNSSPTGLQDLYATVAEIVGSSLPNHANGKIGAEDSHSMLAALKGQAYQRPSPLFFGDHKESTDDPAVLAMRLDDPIIAGTKRPGQWKIFFDATLIRQGNVSPFELYELSSDPKESKNLLNDPDLVPVINHLKQQALLHRRSGGHHLASLASEKRFEVDWNRNSPWRQHLTRTLENHNPLQFSQPLDSGLNMKVTSSNRTNPNTERSFALAPNGLGMDGSESLRIQGGNAVLISFDQPVIIEMVALTAGEGQCGGYYQVGDDYPKPLYCTDADNASREQQGKISDLGLLHVGETLRLDSSPHLGVENTGSWVLNGLSVRLVKPTQP